jgi:hypothetical protein
MSDIGRRHSYISAGYPLQTTLYIPLAERAFIFYPHC